jgi:DNA-binding HxlR family transcriptional regulator
MLGGGGGGDDGAQGRGESGPGARGRYGAAPAGERVPAGQVSADRIGINATDLNCLNLVALTGHMTAGDLARQTGLSTASITGVLDRLEEGGFVRRVRDPHDRRRVIAELADGPGLREVGSTFGPVVKAWRATAADYSDDELRLLLEFQGKVEEVIRSQLARLRSDGEAPPATT